MDKSKCMDLLEAFEAFRKRTGNSDHFSFFFGVALGATQTKIDSEAIIEAINKLSPKQETP